MKPKHIFVAVVIAVAIGDTLWRLHDPRWIVNITSGLRDWEQDAGGARFRWTSGHATFYVPSGAVEMTLPLRAVYPSADGRPVVASISVDDRLLTDVRLDDPQQWIESTVPLPRRSTGRSYRRVDVRVSRVVPEYNRGIQLGEIRTR